jgi:hypothetical protein
MTPWFVGAIAATALLAQPCVAAGSTNNAGAATAGSDRQGAANSVGAPIPAGGNTAEAKAAAINTGTVVPDAPPGSSPETVPAKFSSKNDALDKLPAMTRPFPLSDAQRRDVYAQATAAAGKADTGVNGGGPMPAGSELPAGIEIRALPEALTDAVPGLRGTKFAVRGDKVLLVQAPNRIVLDVIAKTE